jgi:O-antigen/teichoic acid export membrane protein
MSRIAGLLRPDRLRAAAAGGTAAVVGTVVLTNFIRIFSSAVLTRLLTAADYGVIGIITSLTYIIVMLSDFGFFAFIVRHADAEDERFLDEVWTVRLIRSAGITAILIALAWPFAWFSDKPLLAPVVMAWSFNQLFEGLSSLAFAQAVRRGQVPRLSAMELSANVVQTLLSIAFAVVLKSYWAIVAAVLVGALVKVWLSYKLFPGARRRFAYSRERMRDIWTFSRFIAGSSILSLLLGQTDKVVLTRVFPLALFGLYSIATLLALAPRAVVYPFTQRILFPAYSKQFRDHALEGFAAVYYGRRRLVSTLYMFAIGGMIGAAPLLVAVLYDPRYEAVAPMLRIIAISAMLLMNNVAADQAMVAMGRTKVTLHINIARFAWLALAGAAGFAAFGPFGLIWAVGTMEVAAMLYCWWSLRAVGVLRLGQEALGLGAGVVGVAVGMAVGGALLATGWF